MSALLHYARKASEARAAPITILLILLSVAPIYARIGETEAQIQKRYGKCLKVIGDSSVQRAMIYTANGYLILVVYLDGTSESEVFRKENGAPFSSDEVRLLLQNNSGGKTWTDMTKKGVTDIQEWWRDDTKLTAVHELLANRILFRSEKFMQRAAAISKDEATRKMKGF